MGQPQYIVFSVAAIETLAQVNIGFETKSATSKEASAEI
jgi:hypothetical protein